VPCRPGGGAALGIRHEQDAPTEKPVSVWRFKGVPIQWTDDDLFKVMKEAGWSDCAVVAYPTKRIWPRLVRCRPRLLFQPMLRVLIPPRIWVFMNTDWVHWFGARDAKTTISKTNLAHYGHVLSAHRPLPSDHYPSQSFQFPGCQIGYIVVQLCVAHFCVPNVTTGSMLCQIGCIVRGTPLHSTWCHLVVRKDVCTGHHIFRTLQKIHCSLMHTYVNSFSQCLVSSINLTSSVKICVWSRSS